MKSPTLDELRKDRIRSQVNKRRKIRKNLTVICTCIIFITLCFSIVVIANDIDKRAAYEVSLETQLESVQQQNKELQDLLTESSILIDDMSVKITDLEQQHIKLENEIDNLQQQLDKTTVTPVAQVNKHTDLAVQTVMTTDRMNYIIDQWTEREGGNCRFVGHGQAFIDASKITGIDPVAILALSAHESGFGTSKIARTKNNFMGIGAFDASPYESSYTMGDDISQGIVQGAVWVADNYYNEGQTTLHKMIYGGKTYSTSKDKWIDDIVWLWNKSYTI